MAKTKANQPTDDPEVGVIIPEVIEVIDEKHAAAIKANAIQVVSITDAALAEIKAAYGSFKIDGSPEKYKEAKTAKNKLVKIRTTVESRRKQLNKQFNDSCNAEAARITSETTAVEKHLVAELEAFETAEQRRLEDRRKLVVDRLLESGFEFNGINYTCGDHVIWQTEIDDISDDALDIACAEAQTFRQNEATAKAEQLRRSAPVYLHQPDLNELMTLTRGEYEVEAEALTGNGVVEITKERYDAIKEAKLAAFRRPAPSPAPAPAPIPAAVDPRNSAPEHSPHFMEAPGTGAIKQNDGFLGLPNRADTPKAEPKHEGPFFVNVGPSAKPSPEPAKGSELDPIDAHEAAFDTGYECFRKQVVKAFENEAYKFKRSEWIEFFKSLTPTTTV